MQRILDPVTGLREAQQTGAVFLIKPAIGRQRDKKLLAGHLGSRQPETPLDVLPQDAADTVEEFPEPANGQEILGDQSGQLRPRPLVGGNGRRFGLPMQANEPPE